MLTKYLDPARSGTSLQNKPIYRISGIFRKKRAVRSRLRREGDFHQAQIPPRRRVQKQIRLERAGLDVHPTYSAGTDDGRPANSVRSRR